MLGRGAEIDDGADLVVFHEPCAVGRRGSIGTGAAKQVAGVQEGLVAICVDEEADISEVEYPVEGIGEVCLVHGSYMLQKPLMYGTYTEGA